MRLRKERQTYYDVLCNNNNNNNSNSRGPEVCTAALIQKHPLPASGYTWAPGHLGTTGQARPIVG